MSLSDCLQHVFVEPLTDVAPLTPRESHCHSTLTGPLTGPEPSKPVRVLQPGPVYGALVQVQRQSCSFEAASSGHKGRQANNCLHRSWMCINDKAGCTIGLHRTALNYAQRHRATPGRAALYPPYACRVTGRTTSSPPMTHQPQGVSIPDPPIPTPRAWQTRACMSMVSGVPTTTCTRPESSCVPRNRAPPLYQPPPTAPTS